MSSADLFVIGSSGLKGFRAQMGAVSENIANAGTEGYSRREIVLSESGLSASAEPLYVPRANFGGSVVVGVRRANDAYLDSVARQTGSTLAGADARLRLYTDIETALKDDALGVGQSLAGMYGAIERLASSPNDPSLRTNMLYGVEQVVSAFNQAGEELQNTLDSAYSLADSDVKLLNDSLAELARINAALLRTQEGTSNQAQLLDSRDMELAKISRKLNVTISIGANNSGVVSYNGVTVVQGDQATSFSVTKNANGTLNLLHEGAATTTPANGALAGYFDGATTARARLDSLNTLAVQFAADINAWHAQGLTDAGAAGSALVSVGTTAVSLTVALGSVTQIAAKSADGRLNGNLLDIGTTRGTSGVEQGWNALVIGHANVLNTTQQEQAAAQLRDENARSARENVSGVDLDMEAADLLRIQQAYQACAKVIQAARETIDSLLQVV